MDSAQAVELAGIDAIGQASLVAAGELSAVELLEAAIIRLEAARGLNAVIDDLFERGRVQAADLDAADSRTSPLHGVPFLLKDLGASLAGVQEVMGSRALRTHVAAETAWIVERYLDAGLVVFGKTNTPEWGNHCTTEPSLFGPTVNPWSPSITPGGSSGDRRPRWPPASCPRRPAGTGPARSGCLRRAAGSSASNRAVGAARSRREPVIPWKVWSTPTRSPAACVTVPPCSTSSPAARPATRTMWRHRRRVIWMRSPKRLWHNES